MSSYDRYDAQRRRKLGGPFYGTSSRRTGRSTLGYWVPLVLTVTVATAGLIAWVWSERQDEDEELGYGEGEGENKPDYPPRPPEGGYPGQLGSGGPSADSYSAPPGYSDAGMRGEGTDEGLMARMSGAIGRTPSPQQVFDGAGRMAVAGVAAAGAAIGLGSIRQERQGDMGRDKGKRSVRSEREEGFSDHERWNEEAVTRRMEEEQGLKQRSKRDMDKGKGKARKVVAVIVSSDSGLDSLHHEDAEYMTEHASILSHLPQHHDPATTSLFVLIYAPHLTALPQTSSRRGSASYTPSSTPAQTPAATPSSDPYFTALQTQAEALVDDPVHILPFTTPTGYVHMLRHLAPQIVYIADNPTLSGINGAHVRDLKGWVGQVVVVVGDEGAGGLIDTETENETDTEGERREKQGGWWEKSEMVGLGKGVEVVDIGRVGDDWVKRVAGKE